METFTGLYSEYGSNIVDSLKTRFILLEKLRDKLQSMQTEQIEGRLRTVNSQGRFQFYLVLEKNDTKGTYIPNSQINTARKLALQEYLKKQIALIDQELSCLKSILKTWHPEKTTNFFINSSPARQRLLYSAVPRFLIGPKDFSDLWVNTPYKGKTFNIQDPELFTKQGLRVRSKSEILIADCLDSYKIPFKYECPHPLKRMKSTDQLTLYPDFTCLNVQSKSEIIWEHFGLMDNPDYALKAVRKINLYIHNGYNPGKNLIITTETKSSPLSSIEINRIITAVFLN